ncbi:hypothetical protein X737_39025 [Mesorhizobium sp. L48C026A00]|nr:hypothetical protein X737_39025 [Mesorhizobium sp. L48C026A00]
MTDTGLRRASAIGAQKIRPTRSGTADLVSFS